MGQIKITCSWHPNHGGVLGYVDHPKDVHLFVDTMPLDPTPPSTVRVIAILEPFADLKSRMVQYFKNRRECYNFIFTYYQDILDNFSNAYLSVTPITWISQPYPFSAKEFSVSSVFGGKHLAPSCSSLEGYQLRWNLFSSRDRIHAPKRFFLSQNFKIPNVNYSEHLVLTGSKDILFDSQYHIAIENTGKLLNAFSEKLIDCFQTKTVPIYYGPENIGRFFNLDGMICVRSVDEIVSACNNLKPELCDTMRAAIEDNYQRSMKYSSFTDSMIKQINDIMKTV